MRPGIDAEWTAALAAAGITTAICARLDFASGTIGVWTGSYSITPTGSPDSLLNGVTFDCLAHGVAVGIGDNSFSSSGSDPLQLSLSIPAAPSAEIAAAIADPDEYRGRQATFWRAMMFRSPTDPLAEPIWQFVRVRSGPMDKLQTQNDATSHTLILSIEGHAGSISAATQASYLDQTRYDPNDTSQRYAASVANGGMVSGGTAPGIIPPWYRQKFTDDEGNYNGPLY